MTGPLIAAGREADVFALDDRRVLRRYRRDADVTGEADAMRYLAGLGYPVPQVYQASGAEMVLERIDGPTLAESGISAGEAAGILASLLQRLHELPPWPGAAPGTSLLHLDLHPLNILMSTRGPVVIDWCNVRPGDPDLDTGLTALILAQVAVEEDHELAGQVLDAFLRVAPGNPARLLDDVVRFRATQLEGQAPARAAVERVLSCAR